MNWFDQVLEYTSNNLSAFLSHFYPQSNQIETSKGITLNPSPCCGHNDCLGFAKHAPVANCFSCGTKGNHIQMVEEIWGTEEGRDELGKWAGIPYGKSGYESEAEKVKRANNERLQKIYNLAVNFYHAQLMSADPLAEQAVERQTGTNIANGERSHTEETLRKFQIGLSLDNYATFTQVLRTHGFTDLELDEAKKMIWIPPFNYVYPYFDKRGNLIRFNTKPFIRKCLGKKKADGTYTYDCGYETKDTSSKMKKKHEKETGHTMSPDGFSTGQKDSAYYTEPNYPNKKYVILVEGENDVISLDEELAELGEQYVHDFLPVGIGGGITEGFFDSPFFRGFKRIYEAFDNDDGGNKYREQLSKELPDVPTYHVDIDSDFNDIDMYLKSKVPGRKLSEMLDLARIVDSEYVRIEREKAEGHIWHAKNASYELIFEIDRYNYNKMQLEGTLTPVRNGKFTKKLMGQLDTLKVEGGMDAAKYKLSEHLNTYYHEVTWENGEPVRPFIELLDIIRFSKSTSKVIRQIAWYLHKAGNQDEYRRRYETLTSKVKSQKMIAEILKEVNGFTNEEIDPYGNFPKLHLSQFFNITNDDGFFYFSRLIKDGETPKLVPCLLTNKKEEIRLDLLKRKDPQCLLLIQNKYEMPFEVETAVMDPTDVSLQPYWVDKWKNDELNPEDLDPAIIIKEIEDFIRKCYYLEESTLKVLSLWIYATYFYMLFKSGFPYLMFTGPKGTGKSTLDTIVSLLSLNAKLALDISESALYRTITFEGGTFILDEVEHLTDKRAVDSNGYAKILKGGYSDNASVFRSNPDKANATEKFSVFGPKVISNINGIDDVIAERCIYVRTYRVEESKLRHLEDTQLYKEEKRPQVHTITSRAALSSLTHFHKVHELFHDVSSNLGTGNARLSQIMRPLVAMARFVGGDYEKHLMAFYNKEVKGTKEEVASGTTEGILRNLLKQISEECVGLKSEKWAMVPADHAYQKAINYSHSTKFFECDSMHLKVLAEEMNNGEPIDIKLIDATMKAILGKTFDPKRHRTRTTATITNETLQRNLGGNRQVRVYKYVMSVEDYIEPERMEVVNYAEEKPLF